MWQLIILTFFDMCNHLEVVFWTDRRKNGTNHGKMHRHRSSNSSLDYENLDLFHLRFSSFYIHNACYVFCIEVLVAEKDRWCEQTIYNYLYAGAQQHLSFSTKNRKKMI